jgi:hypothetical protein
MKKMIFCVIVAYVFELLTPQDIQAQGTAYLSNLGQTSTGNDTVGTNSLLAIGFRTGNNASGYTLNYVQLEMTDASGNPNGFTVMVAEDSIGGPGPIPGSNLGTLDGSANPSTAGIYTYADDSDIILSPNTFYFILLAAGTTVANGAYELSLAGSNSYAPTDGWLWQTLAYSNNGSNWRYNIYTGFPQFAITATAIPEPSAEMLLGFGGILLVGLGSWRKSVKFSHLC